MAPAVRGGGGQGPEAIELSVELTTEVEGIEALIERLEIHAGSGREDAGGAQALVGGLGPIVDAPDAGPVAVFAHELLHGGRLTSCHYCGYAGDHTPELSGGPPLGGPVRKFPLWSTK